jgi:hypothetical protein
MNTFVVGGRGLIAAMPEVEVDLCPICDVSGGDLCVEEDGQYVLGHWGRSSTLAADPDATAEMGAA